MAKLSNLTGQTVELLGWRILPFSGRYLDRLYRSHRDIPDDIAYSDQAKHLADQGILEIEGYTSASSTAQMSSAAGSPVAPLVRAKKRRQDMEHKPVEPKPEE